MTDVKVIRSSSASPIIPYLYFGQSICRLQLELNNSVFMGRRKKYNAMFWYMFKVARVSGQDLNLDRPAKTQSKYFN
jgi:hypothetical protein